jgi:type I restriction enzyme M protein
MKLEKLFFNIFNKLRELGFRHDESVVNLLAFLVRHQIIAQNLQNSLAIQILEEFQYHTNNQLLKEVEESLVSVDFSLVTSEELRESFNSLIKTLLLNDKRSSQYFTPSSVTNLVIDFANPKPNQTIFDPTCGIGSFFVELNKRFPLDNLKFIGQEINSQIRFLCLMNLVVNKVFNAEIYLGNSLKETYFENQSNIDIALANPPFGVRYPIKNRTSEVAFIELILSSIKKDGKAIVVVPESFLFSSVDLSFRRTLVENDWIETVVSLSQGAFKPYIGIKTSIIVFNKNKANKGFVIFDGKEDRFEKTKINIDEIFLQNCDLQVSRYALTEAKELKAILSESPFKIVKIRDLMFLSISGANYSPTNRIIEQSNEILPYVRVSDLARNETEFELDISEVERKISLEKARKVIDFSVVLVSKIAPKLKPTYFNFTGQPIVIGSDVIALKMKEDVNVEYFLTQLHSRLVQIQVEMMSSGATINRISKEDFLNIQIILPPLEEQQRQILEMRGVIEDNIIAQKKVAKAERQIDAIEYEVIANMNHSLKNKLGVIINDYDTLVRFLQRKERANSPVSFNDTIRPVFENESISDVDTIQLITERLKNNLLDTSKVFNTSLKLQTRELKKTFVELVGYFRNELKPSFAGENFTIKIIADPKLKLNVLLDKEVFKDAIDNLINNAESHGFTDENREYKIVFELSKLKEIYDEASESVKNYARIVYKNDGKSFPQGFSFDDYVRYSSKAGKTQGTGIGGAVIDKIIKMHEGKFNELPTDEHSTFSVQFEILLPLED